MADLAAIMDTVHLAYLVDREGGWDAEKPWKDVLSAFANQPGSFTDATLIHNLGHVARQLPCRVG